METDVFEGKRKKLLICYESLDFLLRYKTLLQLIMNTCLVALLNRAIVVNEKRISLPIEAILLSRFSLPRLESILQPTQVRLHLLKILLVFVKVHYFFLILARSDLRFLILGERRLEVALGTVWLCPEQSPIAIALPHCVFEL